MWKIINRSLTCLYVRLVTYLIRIWEIKTHGFETYDMQAFDWLKVDQKNSTIHAEKVLKLREFFTFLSVGRFQKRKKREEKKRKRIELKRKKIIIRLKPMRNRKPFSISYVMRCYISFLFQPARRKITCQNHLIKLNHC